MYLAKRWCCVVTVLTVMGTINAVAAPHKSSAHPNAQAPHGRLGFSKRSHFTEVLTTPKGCLSSTDVRGALKLIGKHGAFSGVVASIFIPRNGTGYFYIDFNKQWKLALSAAVDTNLAASFPDLRTLLHRKVVIVGVFSRYGADHPQIILKSLNQIHLLK